ncbi:MAG: VWA domain-containing protein, partial [Psychrobacillus psychrotolerans]|uniref:VWA domain-containing protein n=1 Tax=Psychrobacillus psychrotolerans TaxID=126156 RepID=UPI003BB0506A
MKFFKSLQLFLIAILIIGIATPLSTEAAIAKSGDLMKINKTVSNNTLVKGETTDVTLTVQGTPQDSTFVKPNDVVLIIDKSGSMQADNRLNAAKDAAKEFIELMDLSKHELGIVDYSDRASSFPLTTDKSAAKAYVDTIQLGGGTNTSDAIRAATATLANKRSEAQPTIVIMTDGAANSSTDALAAAKAAKDAGITFYSIALLGPNENPVTSAPNKLLQEMASSFDHHHFVLGSVGLSDVYKAIVEEIGLASAYNVTITDTISPKFELVPGSYDHHIPRPTVNGNTISWFISELKTDELSFTYQVRAKADATAGKYTLAQTSSTFEIGDGSTYSLNTTNPIVEIKNHAPIITSIKEDKGHTTGGETVTITGQNFLPEVKVYFGTVLGTVVSVTDNEIIVTT